MSDYSQTVTMSNATIVKIPFCPVPQPRHRVQAQIGADGKPYGKLYLPDDHPVHLWKIHVLDAWRLVMPRPGFRFEGPLCVMAEFVLQRPKTMVWKTKPMPRIPDQRQRSGDLDNLIKSTFDALNSKAWDDDRQVVSVLASKWIASGDEEPHATIAIATLDN